MACCCGVTLVAFLIWYCLENKLVLQVFIKKLRRLFIKENEVKKSTLTKITRNVLSTIVYVLNRIITTTTHILVSSVGRPFWMLLEFLKIYFREVKCLLKRRRKLLGGNCFNVRGKVRITVVSQ